MSDKTTSLTYDQLTAEEQIYMLEFILPESARQVMIANEITAYTDFVPPELQKERPRVEIMFMVGQGKGMFPRPVNGIPVEVAWMGSFQFILITEANMATHSRFVSKVRALMHRIGPMINNVQPMQNHKLQPFSIDAGTSSTFKSEEGFYQTALGLNVNISVQDNAWQLIAT